MVLTELTIPEYLDPIVPAVAIVAGLLTGYLAYLITFFFSRKFYKKDNPEKYHVFEGFLRSPIRLFLPVLLVKIFHYSFKGEYDLAQGVSVVINILLIISLSWLAVGIMNTLFINLLNRYDMGKANNLNARKVYTQVSFLRKIVAGAIIFIAFALVLMEFENVRKLGTSILASAGVIGIIVGIAAQRSIANLLVGIQLAMTQPVRIDDVVIIEGEWGRIEEITATYAVVKIWDMRRLIIPLSYLIEKPIQNWTRSSSEILGSVFLHVDYTADVSIIRKEFESAVEKNDLWNGKVKKVQVTGCSEKTMEVRCLMSADDASEAWELRCQIREHMISFLQKTIPQSLPRFRADMENGGAQRAE